jgi:hypothetical protein
MFAFIAVAVCAGLPSLQADDGAASIAAGGLVARHETRIVMAKEILTISQGKVLVDYDFRNDSGQEVTTEVAFPVPPYKFETQERSPAEQSFQSFHLWIDGRPHPYEAEAKATLKGNDVTQTLRADKIDIPTFGHFRDWSEKSNEQSENPDFTRLPEKERKRLVQLGLFDVPESGYGANWIVHLQYHWTQTLPAHATVHIRHEYSPVLGFSGIFPEELASTSNPRSGDAAQKASVSEVPTEERLSSFCADPPFLRALNAGMNLAQEATQDSKDVPFVELSRSWVDFILTTANTWKTPIEDFTLIVERPKVEHGEMSLISFCSPGPVEKLNADHFQIHLPSFIPNAELHIGFFGVPIAKKSVAPKPKP